MPFFALLLAAAVPPTAPADPRLETDMCVGPCPVLPDPHLRPLAFLAGSCWRAAYVGGAVDTHCFTWMFGGYFLRDRHRVDRNNYAGETIYRWDPATRMIRWDYYSSDGFLNSGTASGTDRGVAFAYRSPRIRNYPPAAWRVAWRRDGPDAYVVTTRTFEQGRWRTEPDPPRFQRIGPAPAD